MAAIYVSELKTGESALTIGDGSRVVFDGGCYLVIPLQTSPLDDEEVARKVREFMDSTMSEMTFTLDDLREAVVNVRERAEELAEAFVELKPLSMEDPPWHNWKYYESSRQVNVSTRFFGGFMGWGWNKWTDEWGYNLKYWTPVLPDTANRSIGRRRPVPIRAGCPPMNRGRRFDRKLR